MSCLAGRNRPQPVLTTEIRLSPERHNPGEDHRVLHGSGFYSTGFQAAHTILSTAKHTLGKAGCTHPGGPRGTHFHQLKSIYRKLTGNISRKFLRTNNKAKQKNAKNCFSNIKRCSWHVNSIFWMAFLALFALLETKGSMAPRVAALAFDGQQSLSHEPQGELYTYETGSRSNASSSLWRRFEFFKNNHKLRKTDRSALNIIKRSLLRERRKTGKYPSDIIRPNAQVSKNRHNQYKPHNQHYNYYHHHYHHNIHDRRSPHHKKHSHNLKPEPILQEKREDEDDGNENLTESEEFDGSDIPYRRMRRSVETDEEVEIDPLERLSRVFGIKRLLSQNGPSPNQIPPEYMTRLYRSITDSGGLTKANGPYNADIVRSFPDRDFRHQMHFFYNVSFLEPNERILQAEFHLFKMRPKNSQPKKTNNPHLISIEIHQVMSLKDVYNPENLKLIDMRRVSAYSHGWITFTVLKAVVSWVNSTSPNYGFLVKATSLSGESFNESLVRFAQRKEHHDTKQPILVVFTDDGLQKHRNFISPNDEGYQEIKRDILRHEQLETDERSQGLQKAIRLLNEKERSEFEQQNHGFYWGHGAKRKRRSADSNRDASDSHEGRNKTSGSFHGRNRRTLFRRKRRNCARYEMYVDFNAIGWSGWIISPKGYNAYHCSGPCPFPLGQSHRPTNHATVQSIVHALRAGKNVLTPCCVPDKLYSISLLYFDDQENVILKLYEDMVAASCGCH